MKKLYQKHELAFALVWIAIYTAAQMLAMPLSRRIGVESSATALFNVLLAAALLGWVRSNGLMERYGLCGSAVPACKFFWYIPLAALVSHNLWNGVAVNMPALDTACYICSMLCIGFLEELLFRGFLFRAIEKDDTRQAIVISSVTFGLGHLLHLVDGSGMELAANLCQVAGAIAAGFLFVTLFHRGGSLLPCILTHAGIDAVSAFASEAGLTMQRRILLSASRLIIAVVYTLALTRTLPKPAEENAGRRPPSKRG